MSNGKRFGCLGILLVLLLAASFLLNLGLLADRVETKKQAGPANLDEEIIIKATQKTDEKIAVIPVHGIISSEKGSGGSMVEETCDSLRQALEDDDVKAIVIDMDSPGGEVTAADAIYHAVREARGKKPVVIYMQSLAASGGYYISCGGTFLMAHETTITGSIGVIIQTLKYRELLGKIGVESLTFKSGKFKDILNPARDMTPEEQAYVQAMVMQTYEKFLGIVAHERKLPADALRNGIADGRIVSGKDALAAKLIDGLGYVEDAYAKARELGHAPGAAVVRYEKQFKLGRIFRLFAQENSQAKIEINIADRILPKLEAGRLYLLPPWLAQ
jgi:protease IV